MKNISLSRTKIIVQGDKKMQSKIYVGNLADELASQGKTMDSQQLAAALNAAGCKTCTGKIYVGGRGTDKLKSAAYNYAVQHNKFSTAKNIAELLVDKKGQTPWCLR
ncbi:MAG: hypothetical protein K5786_05490 [Treponema sp.]|nr:hypothetical protein [Treponema sp.]